MCCPLMLSGSTLTGSPTDEGQISITLLCHTNNLSYCSYQVGVFFIVSIIIIIIIISVCVLDCLPFYPFLPCLLLLCSGHLHLNSDLLFVVCSPLFYFHHAFFDFFLKSLGDGRYNWQLKSVIQVDYPVAGLATGFIAPRHVPLAKPTICRRHVV